MQSTRTDPLQPTLAHTPSLRQRLFMRYFTAFLVDLVVLNLVEEYWSWVEITSFTVSLLAALVLQVLLKLTIVVEHKVADYFGKRKGAFAKFLRFFFAWLVLFGSKFVILEAIDLLFGSRVDFGGPFDGVVVVIVLAIVMLGLEEAIVRLYRRLA